MVGGTGIMITPTFLEQKSVEIWIRYVRLENINGREKKK
jgi:hypothetical protein